jgi:hypothetical protein
MIKKRLYHVVFVQQRRSQHLIDWKGTVANCRLIYPLKNLITIVKLMMDAEIVWCYAQFKSNIVYGMRIIIYLKDLWFLNGQQPTVKSSYQLSSWSNMEFWDNIQGSDVTTLNMKKSYSMLNMKKSYSTEWRNNVEYEKIIFKVMKSCNGNTKTKCGNTAKTIGRRLSSYHAQP